MDDAAPDTDGGRPPRTPRWLPGHGWKLALFVVMTVAGGALGFFFKFGSQVEVTLPDPTAAPVLQVYTDDPTARVDLALTVRSPSILRSILASSPDRSLADRAQPTVEQVGVLLRVVPGTPGRNVRWLVTVANNLADGQSGPLGRNSSGVQQGVVDAFLGEYGQLGAPQLVVAGDSATLDQAPTDARAQAVTGVNGLAAVATLRFGLFDDWNAAGYAARLPQVRSASSVTAPGTALLTVAATSAGPPTALVHDPATPSGVPAGLATTRMADPASQHVVEVLSDADRLFSGTQLTTLVPPYAELSGADLRWESDTGLAPVLQTADIAYAKREAADDFYAGLAFATAAATLVAAVQEIRTRPRADGGPHRAPPEPAPPAA